MDWVVGQVVSAIRSTSRGAGRRGATPIDKDTIIFFTSDNGAPKRPDGNSPLRGYKGSVWEGGYREPGIVWWPGKIAPGSSSQALVATYDIFPTVMALAGVALPTNRIIDGLDMAPVLFASDPQTAAGGHTCILFYKATHSEDGPAGAAQLDQLSAVRCGDWKVYYFIDGDMSIPLPEGVTPGVQTLDAPVIFDLATDWSENAPLSRTAPEYSAAKAAAGAARAAHLATLGQAVNQMGLGCTHDLAICSDPTSQAKYPHLPNCTLSPGNWLPPVCLVGGSRSDCTSQTSGLPSCKFVSCSHPPPAPPAPPIPPQNYLGCFHDKTKFKNGTEQCDLPHIIAGGCNRQAGHQQWGQTVEGCNAACSAASRDLGGSSSGGGGYKYFGVQYGGSGCFCGNRFGSQGRAPDTACNMSCSGDRNETCGGSSLNSVWRVDSGAEAADTAGEE